jgi:lipopolysaccharide export system protein LptC
MRALGQQVDRRQAAVPARGLRPAHRSRLRPAEDRYSRRVVLLKRLLPALGTALLLLVAAWPGLAPLWDRVRFRIPAIDLRAARELKMLHPRYAGTDRLNRPYVVTAEVGRQAPDRNDLMSLERPRGVMIVHGGAKVVLTAATGVYQSQAQLLDLFGGVTMTHQNGTRFVTRRAHADFSDNTAVGHDPIQGHGPSGDIWGQGFRLLDRGDTIIFTGQSHLVLKATKPSKTANPPAALPAAIERTAAQVEAAAMASPAAQPASHRTAIVAPPARAKPAAARRAAAKPHPATKRTAVSHVGKGPAEHKPAGRKVETDAG